MRSAFTPTDKTSVFHGNDARFPLGVEALPFYQFQSDDGEVIERRYPAHDAPDIGQAVRKGGKVYRRIFSIPEVVKPFKPYASPTLPPGHMGCHVNEQGFSVVESREQENRIAKKGLA